MIPHFVCYNKLGEPIYYQTLTPKELEEWAATQTPEQLRLSAWIKERINAS